jgi:peptidoglycan/xylan/chitin deacetylase (PgdA/CDA1 family)
MYTFNSHKNLAQKALLCLFSLGLLFTSTILTKIYVNPSPQKIANTFLQNQKLKKESQKTKTETIQALATFQNTKVLSAQSTQAQNGIPVLLYHGITPNPQKYDVTKEQFIDQMTKLKSLGWQTITISQLKSYLKGENTPPPKSFLLTFDDGRLSSYQNADPVLEALNYTAVIFIITEKLKEGGTLHLNEKQLIQMTQTQRWEFGSHTHSLHNSQEINSKGDQAHSLTNLIWLKEEGRNETPQEYKERINTDLKKSKETIESLTKKPVTTFSFPFGDYGQNNQSSQLTLEEVKKLFSLAFYQVSPTTNFLNTPNQNTLLAKRVSVEKDTKTDELIGLLENQSTP